MIIWVALKENVRQAKIFFKQLQEFVRIQDLCRSFGKAASFRETEANISSWSYDAEGHAKKCVDRCCELATKTTQQLHKVATPCIDEVNSKKKK